ncbi:MAG TPA: hypothetical protein VLE50_04215 [Cellvibrio sp.]|nr:hypothetical protein [Cellvibrio sp.]
MRLAVNPSMGLITDILVGDGLTSFSVTVAVPPDVKMLTEFQGRKIIN